MLWNRENIREGMIVRSADGEKLGKIVALGDTHFEIEKGFFILKDYTVAYSDIKDVQGDECFLRFGKEELKRLNEEPTGVAPEAPLGAAPMTEAPLGAAPMTEAPLGETVLGEAEVRRSSEGLSARTTSRACYNGRSRGHCCRDCSCWPRAKAKKAKARGALRKRANRNWLAHHPNALAALAKCMSAFGGKADMAFALQNVR